MKFENFKIIIKTIQELHNRSRKLYDMGVDIIKYEEDYHTLIKHFLVGIYGEKGYGLIMWWLYDDVDHKLFDKQGDKTIDINSISTFRNLWKYLEDEYKEK